MLFYGIRKTGLPQWEVLPTASSPKGFLVPLLLMACGLLIGGIGWFARVARRRERMLGAELLRISD